MTRNCEMCGKETNNPKYCSSSCSAKKTNTQREKRCKRKCRNCEKTVRQWSCSLCEEHYQLSQTRKMITCKTCGKQVENRSNNTKIFCSKLCKSRDFQGNTVERQKRVGLERKTRLIEMKGGCCEKCGYDKNMAALSFHHREPDNKSFCLDMKQLSNRSDAVIMEEFAKCDLLCMNCHIEHHNPRFNKESQRRDSNPDLGLI